ncbi:MAG: hypothetical protein HY036_01270 [Nitrospirae bacterium]|nr:hypothetical protein [Nitrospirota bacterium]MBI3351188.1 hypothetical protein [Nitrospirota bacterium]
MVFFLLPGCSLGNALFHSRTNSPELSEGIDSFQRKNYLKARAVFTKLIETKIGSPEIEEAQWYLAQIAEKTNTRSAAMVQYSLFLRSYPSGRHRREAQERLALLNTQSEPPPDAQKNGKETLKKTEARKAPARKPSRPDQFSGTFTTDYLYDDLFTPSPSRTTQSRLSEFLDLRWRKGAGPDVRVYFSGTNTNEFINNNNDKTRISKLYVEENNFSIFSNLRFGRQPGSGNTLFNRFDGLAMAFPVPLTPLTLNTGAGFPVDIFKNNLFEIQTNRKFYETYLSVIDFYHLGGKLFFTEEFFQNFSTRKAVGLNGYWLNNDLNITTVIDRDIDFNRFNDILISMDYAHSNIRYSASAEYRKNPFLDYDTALNDLSVASPPPPALPIGSLEILQQTRTREEIQHLALNNTTTTLDYGLGLTVDFTEKWRSDFRAGRTLYNPVDLGSHVMTFPLAQAEKSADRISIFLNERDSLHFGETGNALLSFQRGTDSINLTGVGILSKTWTNGMQGGLKVRGEYFSFSTSRAKRVVPGFVVRKSFQNGVEASLEAEYTMENNSASSDMTTMIQTRTSISIPF